MNDDRPVLFTRRRGLAGTLSLGLMAPVRRRRAAYPERPITLIVPFAPGGIADLTARAVAKEMSATLKQPIVIDNRPSAGAIVGATAVARAEPDGHTVLLMSNANAVSAGLFRKLPFDVQRDFTPVSLLGTFDLALFVKQDAPFKTVRDVIAQAKSAPGKLTIGTIASGSTQHLSAELFKSMAQIDVVVVPYKGTPAVITALRAGEIDLAFEILGPMLPQVQAQAVRRAGSHVGSGASPACRPCRRCRSRACPATWSHRGTRWRCRPRRLPRWCSACIVRRKRRSRCRPCNRSCRRWAFARRAARPNSCSSCWATRSAAGRR